MKHLIHLVYLPVEIKNTPKTSLLRNLEEDKKYLKNENISLYRTIH